jgi:hypothetical protein
MEAAIGAAKDKTDELGKQVDTATMNKQGVANPSGVAYVAVDRVISVAQKASGKAQAAPAGGVALGGNVQPIVISAGVDQSVLTGEMHLPISAMSVIVQTAQNHE